jgi:hypothetical protein
MADFCGFQHLNRAPTVEDGFEILAARAVRKTPITAADLLNDRVLPFYANAVPVDAKPIAKRFTPPVDVVRRILVRVTALFGVAIAHEPCKRPR